MKVVRFLFLMLILVTVLAAPVFSKQTKSFKGSKHPVPMEGQNCLSCHEGDPSHAEWEKSGHGTTLVNCEVCHGEEANFRKKPTDEVCRGCHSYQFENKPVSNVSCIACHPAHSFKLKGHK